MWRRIAGRPRDTRQILRDYSWLRIALASRAKIHLSLRRENAEALSLAPRRENVTDRRFVTRALRYLYNRAIVADVTARARPDHHLIHV